MKKKQLLKSFGLLPLLIFLGLFTSAQTKKISGTVTDDSGKNLSGVSITVKGIANGTVTDQSGNFTFSVNSNAKTLVISYVGFEKQEISIGNETSFTIQLKADVRSLDDVVVVGYSTQKKGTLTGAVSQVKGTDLVKAPAVNLSNTLVGRLPGLISTNTGGEPGLDGANILIRGVNTFSGGTSPLIVIDGVANRPGGFERIDPNDVESVSILKDASASIYGSQAANGVILITTKRGKTGKPKLAFSLNQAFNSWARVPKVLTAEQYAILVNEQNKYVNQAPTYSDAALQKFRDGSDPINFPNTNWIEEVVRPVVLQNRANLSISGGAENIKYYTSFGMVKQGSQFKNSNAFSFEQYNLSANIDAQVTKNFKISYDAQFRYQTRKGPAGSGAASPSSTGGSNGAFQVFTGLLASLPIYPARFPDGRLAATSISAQSFPNPLATSTDIAGEANFNDLFFLNTLRYKLDLPTILKGLSVDGYLAVDFNSALNQDFRKTWSVYKYNSSNQTYLEEIQTLSSGGNASLSQNNYFSRTITVFNKINYNRIINTNHAINAFVGVEQQTFLDKYSGVSKNNFFTSTVPQLDYGSSINVIGFGNSTNTARLNFLGRINYAYSNKYFLELQGRYDGSDRFPENKRWGFFPSVSAGWQIANEKWFTRISKQVTSLKLRASWGKLGNDRISPYQFLQFYNLNANGYVLNNQLVPIVTPGVLANPNFTWESADSYNIGIDAEINKKLDITVELFKQKRSDILTQRLATVPQYSGINLPVENIGIMQNQGIEMAIGYKTKLDKVNVSFGLNGTYVRNKVLYVDEPASLPEYQKRSGKPFNSRLMYIADGLFQNAADIAGYPVYRIGTPRPGDVKFIDQNKDGQINSLDLVRVDFSYTPEIVYGFNLNADWNGFDLSLLLAGQANAKVFFHPQSSATINTYAFMFDGRSTPDKVTDKPSTAGPAFNRPQWNANTHPFFFRNNSFMRLKNAELGYTFTNRFTSKLKIQAARFYINGSNLLTFAKFKDIDPESLSRLDAKVFPVVRTINTGILVTF